VRLTPGVPVAARVRVAVGELPHGGDGALGSQGGGLSGTHGGDEGTYGAHSGTGVGVAHGGEVWFGAQIGGSAAHGGLLMSASGDGLHGYGVGVGVGQNGVGVKSMQADGGLSGSHGGLAFGGGDSGQPEFGMQRTRTATSISPELITTFG